MSAKKHKKIRKYKGYFDIAHMVDTAIDKHIAFVIAVSADKERGAGKTYSACKMLFKRWLENGESFILIVREVKELGKFAEGLMSVMLANEFPGYSVFEKKNDNIFSTVYAQKGVGKEKETNVCGWVLPLKNARNLKNYRGLWEQANVKYFLFDEFMTLDNKYLSNETELFKTIYDTVNGKIEDLPVIMTANTITLGNPWFHLLQLNNKLQSNTRSLITDTCVYENVEVEGLAERHMGSAINRAYGKTDDRYASNTWIGDNDSLVCKPDGWGRPVYQYAIVYKERTYGVYYYPDADLYYVSTSWDSSWDAKYALTLGDDLNIPLLRNNRTVGNLRDWFFNGCVKCANGTIQRMLLDTFG